MHLVNARVFGLLAFGLFGVPAAAQEGKDMKLEDVGFTMRAANTPEQLARLRSLPPRKFIGRTTAGGRYFLYADPDYCKCVFVGNALAMKNYQDMVSRAPLAPMTTGSDGASPDNQIIAEIDPALSDSIAEDDILDYRY